LLDSTVTVSHPAHHVCTFHKWLLERRRFYPSFQAYLEWLEEYNLEGKEEHTFPPQKYRLLDVVRFL